MSLNTALVVDDYLDGEWCPFCSGELVRFQLDNREGMFCESCDAKFTMDQVMMTILAWQLLALRKDLATAVEALSNR